MKGHITNLRSKLHYGLSKKLAETYILCLVMWWSDTRHVNQEKNLEFSFFFFLKKKKKELLKIWRPVGFGEFLKIWRSFWWANILLLIYVLGFNDRPCFVQLHTIVCLLHWIFTKAHESKDQESTVEVLQERSDGLFMLCFLATII